MRWPICEAKLDKNKNKNVFISNLAMFLMSSHTTRMSPIPKVFIYIKTFMTWPNSVLGSVLLYILYVIKVFKKKCKLDIILKTQGMFIIQLFYEFQCCMIKFIKHPFSTCKSMLIPEKSIISTTNTLVSRIAAMIPNRYFNIFPETEKLYIFLNCTHC